MDEEAQGLSPVPASGSLEAKDSRARHRGQGSSSLVDKLLALQCISGLRWARHAQSDTPGTCCYHGIDKPPRADNSLQSHKVTLET